LRQQLGSLVYICKWCTTIRKEIEMYFSPWLKKWFISRPRPENKFLGT
jgi:hypothetical protein